MKKNLIRLNESQLQQIIKESVKRVLNETKSSVSYITQHLYNKFVNTTGIKDIDLEQFAEIKDAYVRYMFCETRGYENANISNYLDKLYSQLGVDSSEEEALDEFLESETEYEWGIHYSKGGEDYFGSASI